MEPLFKRPDEATIQDLLTGSKEGWSTDAEGRRVRSVLDPARLTAHFRKIGAEWNRLRNGPSVHREVVLPLIWLALAERGWVIDRQDAEDAWDLASLTPLRTGGGASNDPF